LATAKIRKRAVPMATVDKFEMDNAREIGSGGYGKVVAAKNTRTGEKVAAKIVSTGRMKMHAIQKEIDLMARFSHPNIIALRGQEQIGKNMVIYMELAGGGELFSRVINAGSLTEDEARPYFRELLLAVQHMHEKGVVHRDLKLENVLLHDDHCKVCDFGLAHVHEPDPDKPHQFKRVPLREVCGSKSYCAPEVLAGRGYAGEPADVWSCGICLFAMLAGFFPLDEASGSDWRFERVKMAAAHAMSATHTIFGFYERPCTLTREVTDLIDGMLIVDPARRLTVQEVINSPWFTGAKIPNVPSATYRGSIDHNMDPEALKNILAQESDEAMPQAPVYRGLAGGGGQGPPPLLRKQNAMFCADFNLADD